MADRKSYDTKWRIEWHEYLRDVIIGINSGEEVESYKENHTRMQDWYKFLEKFPEAIEQMNIAAFGKTRLEYLDSPNEGFYIGKPQNAPEFTNKEKEFYTEHFKRGETVSTGLLCYKAFEAGHPPRRSSSIRQVKNAWLGDFSTSPKTPLYNKEKIIAKMDSCWLYPANPDTGEEEWPPNSHAPVYMKCTEGHFTLKSDGLHEFIKPAHTPKCTTCFPNGFHHNDPLEDGILYFNILDDSPLKDFKLGTTLKRIGVITRAKNYGKITHIKGFEGPIGKLDEIEDTLKLNFKEYQTHNPMLKGNGSTETFSMECLDDCLKEARACIATM